MCRAHSRVCVPLGKEIKNPLHVKCVYIRILELKPSYFIYPVGCPQSVPIVIIVAVCHILNLLQLVGDSCATFSISSFCMVAVNVLII